MIDALARFVAYIGFDVAADSGRVDSKARKPARSCLDSDGCPRPFPPKRECDVCSLESFRQKALDFSL